MCHVSCAMLHVSCHVSSVMCHVSNITQFEFYFFYRVVELVIGWSAIYRATLSSFCQHTNKRTRTLAYGLEARDDRD